MHVNVEYTAQLKQAAGCGAEQVEVEPHCTVQELTTRLAERHGEPLHSMVLDGQGGLSASVLVFVSGVQVRGDRPVKLKEYDVVTFLSPISGG